MYTCRWPDGCTASWFDMLTIAEGDEAYEMPLCQKHYDLLITSVIAFREDLPQAPAE
jgi:hypothetical protein